MLIRDESGFTLLELMAAAAIGLIVMMGAYAILDTSQRETTRIAERMNANQRARPALQSIMDQIRSSCVSSGVTPIKPGSTQSAVTFVHYTGPGVDPVPARVTISYENGKLIRRTYPANGGDAPNWTFSATPSTSVEIINGVKPATLGNPPSSTPFFRYFAHVNGVLSETPLPVPLSAADANRTTQVAVAFAVEPGTNSTRDEKASLSVSNKATLLFTPASDDPTEAVRPCT